MQRLSPSPGTPRSWRGLVAAVVGLTVVAVAVYAVATRNLLALGATPFVRNGWGQSPLALAAAYGSVEGFRAALAAISETVWVCGSVACVRTPLEEIDPIFKHVGGREFQCCAGKERRHAPSADGREGKDSPLLRAEFRITHCTFACSKYKVCEPT